MTFRVISGLKWARRLDAKPDSIPTSRPRGAKRHGVKYERDFAKALPEAEHGVWFEFFDSNGHGHCQPDLFLRVGETIVVFECKYTWTEVGHWQVMRLYKPVLEATYGLTVVPVVVCKNLVPGAPKSTPSLESAIRAAILSSGRQATVLHWLAGPLWTGTKSTRASDDARRALASL